MNRRIKLAPVTKPLAVAIALFEKTTTLPESYAALDKQVAGTISAALKRADLSLCKGDVTALHTPASAAAGAPARVFLIGLGDKSKFSVDALRNGSARILRSLFTAKLNSLRMDLTAGLTGSATPDVIGRAIGDGLGLASFEFDEFKGTANKKALDKKKEQPAELTVQVEQEFRDGVSTALQIAESANLARTLQATPPNVAHTKYLVDFAKKTAAQAKLKFSVIDAKKAASLKMGGLLAVGAAGTFPPALICMEHKPAKTVGGTILLVGKAVTFDTGGYSIKPAENMDKMKYDKSGGCAVIGAMHAIARLKLPVHVVGLVPTAENMVSDKAYRPGDILTMFNGVTVEVTNTDAEGRLILGDALSYGVKTYKPKAIVDLATLTGGVIVALGTQMAGCFCSDTEFRKQLFDAADFTGERLWHLPLWDEHKSLIKGTHGDLVNSGGREAHAIQGAAFLSYFVGPDGAPATGDASKDPAWAHLDIAGVADTKKDSPLFPAGPTAFGVRLLVRLAENWK